MTDMNALDQKALEAARRATREALMSGSVGVGGAADVAITAYLAVAEAVEPVGVPEGWMLVPSEPTKAMIEAGLKKNASNPHPWCPAVYRAMVAAAPAPNHIGGRLICDALGFDPTNHHNAAKCPYCNPDGLALAAAPTPPASSPKVRLHRFRPIGAQDWSEWRIGPANLTPASGCEWEDVDFVPALAPSPPVSVKPLEWIEGKQRDSVGNRWWRGLGSFEQFSYRVHHDRDEGGINYVLEGRNVAYLTLDDAKAAAQADYEARITAALSPDIQGDGE